MKTAYTVELTYFKETGKYYSEGGFVSNNEALHDIFAEVRKIQRDRMLPGLVAGSQFHVLIEVPDHPHNHPKLLLIEGSVAPTFAW